ncbi:hypothetical protein ID1076_14670 [Helicobacter pylori]
MGSLKNTMKFFILKFDHSMRAAQRIKTLALGYLAGKNKRLKILL